MNDKIMYKIICKLISSDSIVSGIEKDNCKIPPYEFSSLSDKDFSRIYKERYDKELNNELNYIIATSLRQCVEIMIERSLKLAHKVNDDEMKNNE